MKIASVRLAMATALAVSMLGVATLSAGGAEAKPSQEYVVYSDPRLCPSPLCGGYWVALANRSRTRCPDRKYRPRCYVASAWPASRTIYHGALVQGGIASHEVPGFGNVGTLIATDVRNPVGGVASGSYYRLRDIGVRCVREPCFSIRAFRLNTPGSAMLSGLDLEKAGLLARLRKAAAISALVGNGLFVAGQIERTNDGGRVLRVSRIYLRGVSPRG